MRHTTLKLLALVTLLLLAAGAPARAQDFDYDAYEPRTLVEMIAKYDGEELRGRQTADGSRVFGASFPSRVKVTYTGDSRKIPDARRQFIGDWVATRKLDPNIGRLFESEWKFTEDGVEFWLPVQKQVAAYFGEELKKGDAVMLYVIIAGGVKVAGKWEWLILANEFDKVEPPKPAV